MSVHESDIQVLDSVIKVQECLVSQARKDFQELSKSLNHAMSESDDARAQPLLKLKNIARDRYQATGTTLNKLKRCRAKITGTG